MLESVLTCKLLIFIKLSSSPSCQIFDGTPQIHLQTKNYLHPDSVELVPVLLSSNSTSKKLPTCRMFVIFMSCHLENHSNIGRLLDLKWSATIYPVQLVLLVPYSALCPLQCHQFMKVRKTTQERRATQINVNSGNIFGEVCQDAPVYCSNPVPLN